MKERIKELRKALGLTQLKFASRIGMKSNTIATYEMGRAIPSEPTINNICKEFKVNEQWLRTGEGKMFIKQNTFSLDEFAKEHGASELEIGIMKVYLKLAPSVRAEMMANLQELITHTKQDTINQEIFIEKPDEKDAEIERLRLQNAKLKQLLEQEDELLKPWDHRAIG